jgi:hypothetical protein
MEGSPIFYIPHYDRILKNTFRGRFLFLKRLKPYFFNAALPPN